MPRGKSHSRRPVSKRPPPWCRANPEEVEALVKKLAMAEVPSSEIGVTLRDQYGIPLVKPIVGKTIGKILMESGLRPTIPEDLNNLIEKASGLIRHLAVNKSDASNKQSLQLIQSRIRSLARYYKKRGFLPEDWNYRPETEIF